MDSSLSSRAEANPTDNSKNVGDVERMASVAAGAAIVACGLSRNTIGKVLGVLVGGGLIYRGVEGYCVLYQALGISTADSRRSTAAVPAEHGVTVRRSIQIGVPAEEAYRFWRVLNNISRVLPQIESVSESDPKHSTWVARSSVGTTLQWNAEIIEDRPREIIAWRSLPGSEVDTAGSVRFHSVGAGDDTEIHVAIKYDPPGGKAAAYAADFFGVGLEDQLEDGLGRLKEVLEQRSGVAQSAARARDDAVSG